MRANLTAGAFSACLFQVAECATCSCNSAHLISAVVCVSPCVFVCVCGRRHSETEVAEMIPNLTMASMETLPLDLFDGWLAHPFEWGPLISLWKMNEWISEYINIVDVKMLFLLQSISRVPDRFFSVWFMLFYGEKQIWLLYSILYVIYIYLCACVCVKILIDCNRFPGLSWRLGLGVCVSCFFLNTTHLYALYTQIL